MGRTARVAVRTALVGAATAAAVIGSPAIAQADTCVDSGTGAPLALEAPPCADVLAQEARWLTAITSGDVATVDSMLSPTYRHVNAAGEIFDRTGELATTEPLDITFHASDQIVDIAGDTAVIHGVNTLMQAGKVKDRQRFSDVFVLQNGVWKALSAQETRI
jgi:Domain of unknown function (DUF4440)